jgi:hypothetical protein
MKSLIFLVMGVIITSVMIAEVIFSGPWLGWWQMSS